MTYYDEMGIARGASTAEIRSAYRQMAKLFHPDLQSDAHLRQLAETQMVRLNTILAVLLDPASRRKYERSLEAASGSLDPLPPIAAQTPLQAGVRKFLARRGFQADFWVWMAALAAAVIIIAVLFWDRTAPGPVSPALIAADSKDATESALASKRTISSRADSKYRTRKSPDLKTAGAGALRHNRRAASPERSVAASALQPPPSLAPETIVAGEPPAIPGLLDIRTAVPAPAVSIVGDWLHIPEPGESVSRDRYPPEFIQMRIDGTDGKIRGSYDARYRVLDRAVSGAVSFQFAGRADGAAAAFEWASQGGAAGRIELKLLSPTKVRVVWRTTKPSHRPVLVSGTAVLTRVADR